ncbi:PilZ domain-containing protein [Erythrobacter sp.]|uniref:PilZ domain-containing protein n=1 Tax=Erythrobacter sp. TaxID=1042 RepID=UPI0025FED573|nr:PilZ domain-containing protein [Erythrobacter sp.]
MTIGSPHAITAQTGSAILPEGDRRTDGRVQTVFRIARVITGTDEGLARITNLSDRGAGLRMMMPASLSESLTLEFADGVELRGHVVWQENEHLGLQFDQPIDCAHLLAVLAEGARLGSNRPVRLPLMVTALTRSEVGLRSAKVVDISLRGLKLEHDGSLTEGLDLKVTLPSGIERLGRVRWVRGDRAGVMLLQSLSLDALGSIQRLMRTPEPPVGLRQEPQGADQVAQK